MNLLLKFDICLQYVLLYILYYDLFNRGPRGRLAIIANSVFLYIRGAIDKFAELLYY